MGRAFEYRKASKMKRWDAMAKAFTKIGREIAMAVKSGGSDPKANPLLRIAVQNAKSAQMPKERVEAAIKKATEKDTAGFETIFYEGYGPHGVAIMVETATDNTTRTVANVRAAFGKGGGQMAVEGALKFLFERKGHFKIKADKRNAEELELELIDHGLEELWEEDDLINIYTSFADFSTMNKALEEKGIEVDNAALVFVANDGKKLSDEQADEVFNLIDRLEQDDDVQSVYHNMQ